MSEYVSLDSTALQSLEYYMPEKAVLQQLSDFFSIFSDSTRLKILSALSIQEMCVGDISKSLDINQTTVSHQLKLLKSAGAVQDKREGKIVYYRVVGDNISEILLRGVEHIMPE